MIYRRLVCQSKLHGCLTVKDDNENYENNELFGCRGGWKKDLRPVYFIKCGAFQDKHPLSTNIRLDLISSFLLYVFKVE